jgi:hypothetical protein
MDELRVFIAEIICWIIDLDAALESVYLPPEAESALSALIERAQKLQDAIE